MTTREQFTSGFSWNTLTVVLQVAIQLIYTALLARLIEPQGFALMGVVLSLMGFAEIFSQVGIGPALIQRKEVHAQHISGAFWTAVVLGTVFTAAFMVLAGPIANAYAMPEMKAIIWVVATSFIISALGVVPRSMMMKEMRFRDFFRASMISIVGGNLIVGLTLAWLGWEVWAYVWALFAQNALMTIALWWLHPVRPALRWQWSYTRELLRYGTGSTLFNALNYAATKVDVTLVPLFSQRMPGAQDLRQAGLYERSAYVVSLPITIMAKLSDSVLFSGMARMQDETARLRKTVAVATNLLSVIIIPSSIFVIVCAPEIIRIYLGAHYDGAVPVLQVLFVAVIFRTLSRIADALLRARDATFRGSWVKAVYLVLMAAGVIIGSRYGTTAVAAAIVVTTFIHYLMSLRLCRDLVGSSPREQLRAIIPGTILGILAAATSWPVAHFLRNLQWPGWLVLLVTASACAVCLAVLVFRYPILLGGRSLNLLHYLPARLARFGVVQKMRDRHAKDHPLP